MTAKSVSERTMKIGLHLAKSEARDKWYFCSRNGVYQLADITRAQQLLRWPTMVNLTVAIIYS